MGFSLLQSLLSHVVTESPPPSQPYTVVYIDVCNLQAGDRNPGRLLQKLQAVLTHCRPTARLYLASDAGPRTAQHEALAHCALTLLAESPASPLEVVVIHLEGRGHADDCLRCTLHHDTARYATPTGPPPPEVQFLLVSDDTDLVASSLCAGALAHVTLLLPEASDLPAGRLRLLPMAAVARMVATPDLRPPPNPAPLPGPPTRADPLRRGGRQMNTFTNRKAPPADVPAAPPSPLAPEQGLRVDFVFLSAILLGTDALLPLLSGPGAQAVDALRSAWRCRHTLLADDFPGQTLLTVTASARHRLVLRLNRPAVRHVLAAVKAAFRQCAAPPSLAADHRGRLLARPDQAHQVAGTTRGFFAGLLRGSATDVEAFRAGDAAQRAGAARGYLQRVLHLCYHLIRGWDPNEPPPMSDTMPAIADVLNLLEDPAASALQWPPEDGHVDGPTPLLRGVTVRRYARAPGGAPADRRPASRPDYARLGGGEVRPLELAALAGIFCDQPDCFTGHPMWPEVEETQEAHHPAEQNCTPTSTVPSPAPVPAARSGAGGTPDPPRRKRRRTGGARPPAPGPPPPPAGPPVLGGQRRRLKPVKLRPAAGRRRTAVA